MNKYMFSSFDKILLVGSAPYVKEWSENHVQWFIDNGYKIVPFNNAWKLIPLIHIYEWHKSANNENAGTFVPNDSEKKQMGNIVKHDFNNHKYSHLYVDYLGGTMLFNVLYYYLIHYPRKYEIALIGTDLIYKQNGDTFYSKLSESKARNDPLLKYGEKGLNAELQNCLSLYNKSGNIIYNASPYESRLPFKRFLKYMK
jgi:hypothetical protein